MIRLALPGMIMVEAQYFAFEVLTLAASQFGSAHLAAQSVLVTVTSTTFNIPFPLSIAASTRVANLIGAKLSDAARTSAKVVCSEFWKLKITVRHAKTLTLTICLGTVLRYCCWSVQHDTTKQFEV